MIIATKGNYLLGFTVIRLLRSGSALYYRFVNARKERLTGLISDPILSGLAYELPVLNRINANPVTHELLVDIDAMMIQKKSPFPGRY